MYVSLDDGCQVESPAKQGARPDIHKLSVNATQVYVPPSLQILLAILL